MSDWSALQVLILLVTLVLGILITSIVLASVAMARARRATEANDQMQNRLAEIMLALEMQGRDIAGLRQQLARHASDAPQPQPTTQPLSKGSPFLAEAFDDGTGEEAPGIIEDAAFASTDTPVSKPAPFAAAASAPAQPQPEASYADLQAEPATPGTRWARGGLERQFGAVLPVWIGGIALAFSGFFLVKYSIDNDLIGPHLRIVLGLLLGLALIAGGRFVRIRSGIEEGFRIAQSLTGAGLAVLYVSISAGTNLYNFPPPVVGFAGMTAVTGAAVLLALRHGPPIALMGMMGGFLTPALISTGHPSALSLYAYLFVVYAALMIVIRRQGWWGLAFPATILAFAWVLVWIFSGNTSPGETLWSGAFLIAVAGTLIAATRERYAEEIATIQTWRQVFSRRNRTLALNVLAIAGALGLMAVLASTKGFGLYDWALFGVLALGTVALGYFDTWRYGFAPWAAMAVAGAMLAGWTATTPSEYALVLSAFGALFVASGFLLLSSAAAPLLWSGLSAATALGYFLLAYYRLQFDVPAAPQDAVDAAPSLQPTEPLIEAARATAASVVHVWGGIAMALSLLFLGGAFWAARRFPSCATKDRVLATYALATTAFLAIALTIELKREFLSVAIAAELMAVAWVYTRTAIPSLRAIAGLLGAGFAYLLVPQILLLVRISALSVLYIHLTIYSEIPIVDYPTFQLALPAVFFLIASWLFRPGGDGLLTRTLEFAALALLGLWLYYTMTAIFHPGENPLTVRPGYLERGIVSNVLFMFGLGCLVIARLFGREAFKQAGVVLTAVALFRIFYFALLIKNPLWHGSIVPGLPLFNALAVTLLVPLAWVWLTAREFIATGNERLTRIAGRAGLVTLLLVFAWLTLEVRRLYQGPVLNLDELGQGELYTYSVAWLLFGLALLFIGTLKGVQMLRYASLVVILLAVTKVFLIDARGLEGLFRVFSFMGLGLSLLGLSYFYGRFVFTRPVPEPEPAEKTAPSP